MMFSTQLLEGKGGYMIINIFVRLVLSLAGVVAAVLGAHGLVVSIMGAEAFAKDPQELFLVVQVPEAFRSTIQWMSYRGADSWVIPAVFIAVALALWFISARIHAPKKQAAV
jgi:hypothetical protein